MISYEPLYHMLINRGINVDQLRKDKVISSITISKFKKHESITLTTVEKLCKYFRCNIEDIVKIVID